MELWIDADGCPVVKCCEQIAEKYEIPLTAVKNLHHRIELSWGKVITVDGRSDQADFYIANHIHAGDVVITQDYGLAAMVIAKKALVINQYGQIIDANNIDFLLERRHFNKMQRMQTGKSTKFKKRSTQDDEHFASVLVQVITANRSADASY